MHAEAKKIDWKAKLLSQEQQLQSITKGETIFYKKNFNFYICIFFYSLFTKIQGNSNSDHIQQRKGEH